MATDIAVTGVVAAAATITGSGPHKIQQIYRAKEATFFLFHFIIIIDHRRRCRFIQFVFLFFFRLPMRSMRQFQSTVSI